MKYFVFLIIIFFSLPVLAQVNIDTDLDGVSDKDETDIYYTNPNLSDTDGDGYNDWDELNNGYSPHNPSPTKLEESDFDKDGLSDRMELNFHTDLTNIDSDGDGYMDGDEVHSGYDPLSDQKIKLKKRIEVNTAYQQISYFLKGIRLGSFSISSGINNSTPKGYNTISNKSIKAWSPYGLWMPYWMGLGNGRIGLHELPVWPDGTREGEDHLGTPVSHGCVRLGTESAQFLYSWAEIGTPVIIY